GGRGGGVRPARTHARTGRERESESRSSAPGGRQPRSPASETGDSACAPEQLSGEPLPALRAAALEDRLAGTRRHPRTEAVTTLPPTHVWLVGPLHEDEERRRKITPKGDGAAPVYPSGRTQSSPQPKVLQRRRNVTFRHASSTGVERRVEPAKDLQSGAFSSPVSTRCRRLAMVLSSRLPRPERSGTSGVERPIELTAETLWNEVAGRLKGALNETTYRTWFAEAEGQELTDDAFLLGVPNDFTREWIEGHFLGLIGAAVRDVTGQERHLG